MTKLKSKLILSGVAAIAAFYFALQADAARMDMVDVSNHNGYMSMAEYNSMRTEFGVKAVTVKISEGTTYKDPYATSNIANVQAAKLYVNGYHFARYTTKAQAIAEGDFAGRTAKAAGLPVGAVLVADVEAGQGSLSKATNNTNNQAFMKQVEKYGYRSDVYTMGSWVGTKMDLKKGTGWPASYPFNATGKAWYTWAHGWQYSSTARFRISSGNFDVSQLYDNYYTAGQKSTVKPTDKQAVKQATKPVAKKAAKKVASIETYKQAGTFYPTTTLNVRSGAGTGYSKIATYYKGEHVAYDQVTIHKNYVWARYRRSVGGYGFVALGVNGGQSYGKRVVAGKAANHVYYSIKSGDSLWAIANQHGTTISKLCSLNGIRQTTTIYPNRELLVTKVTSF